MASNYQPGYDKDRFETIVNRNFHCLICFNVLKDPVMCRRNEHYFCRGCITRQLHTNSRTCPTCADELSVETLNDVPRIVKDYLNELSIRCDYYDRGCRELVQLQNLEKHVVECSFKPVVCGNEDCGEILSKRDRTYHESEQCDFRKLKCHNCGEISTMMADMRTEMTKMSTGMANNGTKVENLDTEIKRMDTKFENFDTNMGSLYADVEAKFEAVNNEVRGIKTSLSEVQDGFDHLKEAVLDKIERQERTQDEVTKDASATASGLREKQHIFVAGGSETNSVEIFKYRQKLWSLLKPMPEKRYKASSFVYDNHVTVAGGECPDGCLDNMIRMNIHSVPDLSTNWSAFAPKLPAKMWKHSSVVYNDSLFITGGYKEDQHVYLDDIHEVQLKPPYTVELVSKMPEPRVCHSTVLSDDNILIFGGKKSGFYKDNLSSVLSYDMEKGECRQLPPLPYPVSDMATVKWAENVVIIGGAEKDGEAKNSVVFYNTKTGNSHMLPPMLHKRAGCMAVVIENMIVVLGGRGEGWKNLKSVEGFSFDRYTWENLPDMKETRVLATAVTL